MTELFMGSEAPLRAADALLRVNGGRAVILRMPKPGVAGDAKEGLGLLSPELQDVELAPAVFRKTANATSLMISATAVVQAAGAVSAESAAAMFAAAVGVLVDGVLYAITNATAGQAMGSAYCYVLELRGPMN